jgi:predicted transcriptional regulator
MPQSILEMAKDLIMAQIQAGRVPPEDLQQALEHTYASLIELKMKEETGAVGGVAGNGSAPAPVDWKKSITKNAITCLECGRTFKQLSTRHLREHGLDGRSYRAKYGIPRTQPLSARVTTARRKQIVEETRPWEKAARYRAARERDEAEQMEAAAKSAAPPKKRRPRQRTAAQSRS